MAEGLPVSLDLPRHLRIVEQRIAQLEEWFAQKDYLTGVHYARVRRAVDPAN